MNNEFERQILKKNYPSPYHKFVKGSCGKTPLIHNRSSGWKCGIGFTRRPLYPRERTPTRTEEESVRKLWRNEIYFPFRHSNPEPSSQ